MSEREEITVVVPVFNEQDVLPLFHERLYRAMREIANKWSALYVNDGSSDRTLDTLLELKEKYPGITVIDLSRNFGKEAALTAGLDHAEGQAVVVIDADLQDPPELIGTMLDKLSQGHDVVYARRRSRKGETWLKKSTAYGFYWLMNKCCRTEIPRNVGDFRVMNRRAVDAVRKLREKDRFMKGLFAWIGFRQTAVDYDRDPRHAGESGWSYWRLWNFALDGITSFSTAPLKISTYSGMVMAMLSLVYALVVVFKKLIFGDPVPGYPSMMAAILFLGGIQLFSLGVIGEYLGRLFRQTKGRPLYFISEIHRDDRPQP